MSSASVKKPKSALRYFLVWMWRHFGSLHWSYSSAPTTYGNSPVSGFNTHYTLNIGHYSQLRMNGQLSSMSWKCWGHFDTGPFGCRRGIQSHCITSSQCTTTCSVTWTAWCWPSLVLASVPSSDRLYYSSSRITRTWPVQSGFVPNGSPN